MLTATAARAPHSARALHRVLAAQGSQDPPCWREQCESTETARGRVPWAGPDPNPSTPVMGEMKRSSAVSRPDAPRNTMKTADAMMPPCSSRIVTCGARARARARQAHALGAPVRPRPRAHSAPTRVPRKRCAGSRRAGALRRTSWRRTAFATRSFPRPTVFPSRAASARRAAHLTGSALGQPCRPTCTARPPGCASRRAARPPAPPPLASVQPGRGAAGPGATGPPPPYRSLDVGAGRALPSPTY